MLGILRAQIGTLLALAPMVSVLHGAAVRGVDADASGLRLEVSLSARQLSVIENGRVVQRYTVAVGRAGNPTPTGSFRTGRITWNPSWHPPKQWWARNRRPQPPGAPENPMQGVKIYFRAPDYYIHGTNNPGSIGSASSRGCIRMTEGEAKALARRIQKAGGGIPLLIKS
jgi:lipoprotein-anchoring transpeptidase ErfK/SrfK